MIRHRCSVESGSMTEVKNKERRKNQVNMVDVRMGKKVG
jgi:hypothetical protein